MQDAASKKGNGIHVNGMQDQNYIYHDIYFVCRPHKTCWFARDIPKDKIEPSTGNEIIIVSGENRYGSRNEML